MSSLGDLQRVLTQFKSEDGQRVGQPFDLPLDINANKLQLICNTILQQEEPVPYLFFINDTEIKGTLREAVELNSKTFKSEEVLEIIYAPQAVFKVQAVTRCTSSIPGHAEAVISIAFSPDGQRLASGSGDTTVRFWDVNLESPQYTCNGHKNWVLCIAWAPNGKYLASACKNGVVIIWDAQTGKQFGNSLSGHKQWINYLSWEPLHWLVIN